MTDEWPTDLQPRVDRLVSVVDALKQEVTSQKAEIARLTGQVAELSALRSKVLDEMIEDHRKRMRARERNSAR